MSRSLALVLGNELSELIWVDRAVDEFLQELDVPEAGRYAVRLTLEEILSNIVKYAFPGAERHEISVRVSPESGFIALHFEDDGRPFDPTEVPAPDTVAPLEERRIGGLGLHLVRAFSDRISYRRNRDRNHLEIRIGAGVFTQP